MKFNLLKYLSLSKWNSFESNILNQRIGKLIYTFLLNTHIFIGINYGNMNKRNIKVINIYLNNYFNILITASD